MPMETRNASSYLLAFDNTGGVVLGVAVANVSAQAGVVGFAICNDAGAVITTGSLPISGSGHTSFVLPTAYPMTANIRGTIEFDTPTDGQISVLGIRTTPLGASNTLTTIPALANVGTSGGSIAHLGHGKWLADYLRAGQYRRRCSDGTPGVFRRCRRSAIPAACVSAAGRRHFHGIVLESSSGCRRDAHRAKCGNALFNPRPPSVRHSSPPAATLEGL